jgi:hypothetical protein
MDSCSSGLRTASRLGVSLVERHPYFDSWLPRTKTNPILLCWGWKKNTLILIQFFQFFLKFYLWPLRSNQGYTFQNHNLFLCLKIARHDKYRLNVLIIKESLLFPTKKCIKNRRNTINHLSRSRLESQTICFLCTISGRQGRFIPIVPHQMPPSCIHARGKQRREEISDCSSDILVSARTVYRAATSQWGLMTGIILILLGTMNSIDTELCRGSSSCFTSN